MRKALFLSLLLFTGCASTGTGSKWWAPATWFSHSAADRSDKADARVAGYKDQAIKAAQKSVHEAKDAIAQAPASRPVDVAKEATDNAAALLDQAAGPLTAAELAAIRSQVAGLLSENAQLRADAEKQREEERGKVATLSTKLADAVRDSQTANDRLRAAFDRENALANQLRSQRAFLWILGVLSFLATCGYLYVRFALGGLPGALGTALASAQRQAPSVADAMRSFLDTHLNRSEQDAVRAAFSKASQ